MFFSLLVYGRAAASVDLGPVHTKDDNYNDENNKLLIIVPIL